MKSNGATSGKGRLSRAIHAVSIAAGYPEDDLFQRFLSLGPSDLRVDLYYPALSKSLVICNCVSQKSAQGEFNATRKRFATEAGGRGGRVVGDWFGSGPTGGLARSQGCHRLQQCGTSSEGR